MSATTVVLAVVGPLFVVGVVLLVYTWWLDVMEGRRGAPSPAELFVVGVAAISCAAIIAVVGGALSALG